MLTHLLKSFAAFCTTSDCNLPNVNADAGTFKSILSLVFTVVGALTVIFIVYGGVRYVLSTGSPEETRKAKDIIVYAVVGLIVSIMAFTVVNFVASR